MKTIMAARSSRDVSSQAQCSSARTFSTQCACRSAAPFSQQRMLNDEERFTAVSINRRMAGRSRPCDIEVKLQCRNQRTEQLMSYRGSRHADRNSDSSGSVRGRRTPFSTATTNVRAERMFAAASAIVLAFGYGRDWGRLYPRFSHSTNSYRVVILVTSNSQQ
jgi:hypothetical protein